MNTDNLKMFGNSLAGQYRTLETVLGFSAEEIQVIATNGVRASWMAEEKKDTMIEMIMAAKSIVTSGRA